MSISSNAGLMLLCYGIPQCTVQHCAKQHRAFERSVERKMWYNKEACSFRFSFSSAYRRTRKPLSPTRLLDTRQRTFERRLAEFILKNREKCHVSCYRLSSIRGGVCRGEGEEAGKRPFFVRNKDYVDRCTYSPQTKSAENTSGDAAHDAAVLDLRGPRVAVHLAQLQHRPVAYRLRQRCVADHVPEGLSDSQGSWLAFSFLLLFLVVCYDMMVSGRDGRVEIDRC
jgi:hypothetical protein